MAREDDGQERTERATPRREQQAREKGQVPRSRELTTTAVLLAASGGFFMFGGSMLDGLKRVMQQGLTIPRERVFSDSALAGSLGHGVLDGLMAVAPLLGLLVIVALAAPLAIGGLSFSPSAFAFQGNRIDPISGMKRIFSWNGLVELVKALAKFLLVGAVGLWLLKLYVPDLLGLGTMSLAGGFDRMMFILGISLMVLSASLIVVALVDVPFQLWNHQKSLRMTRQEMRDEIKETEGRPEVKARIRRVQQEMARRRMMAEVPKADVVVTNPTHYAVALRYDTAKHRAPVVVAKGADLVAAEIRRLAREARVPLLEAPPLARALFASTDLDQEIPSGLYQAVARVLAWVYQLRHVSGYGPATKPQESELPIPPDLAKR